MAYIADCLHCFTMDDLLPVEHGPDFETHVFSSDGGSSGEEEADEDMVQTMGSKHSGDEKTPSRGRSPARSQSRDRSRSRSRPVSRERADDKKQALKSALPKEAEESVAMQSICLVNEEGTPYELKVQLNEDDHQKWQTYLDGVNSNSDFTPSQKNGVNKHCHKLLRRGKKFPNLCSCCGLPVVSKTCRLTPEEKKALKDDKEKQKQKRAQEREDDKQIRAYQAGMLKEENKAKRAEATKRKNDVLEACDGMSVGEVKEAVAMFKAAPTPVTKEKYNAAQVALFDNIIQ